MPSYPAGMSVSNRAAIMLADQLRHHRTKIGTRWRRLDPGQQALLTLAHLRKGETYADLARGFAIGTTTVYCYAAISSMWTARCPSAVVHVRVQQVIRGAAERAEHD